MRSDDVGIAILLEGQVPPQAQPTGRDRPSTPRLACYSRPERRVAVRLDGLRPFSVSRDGAAGHGSGRGLAPPWPPGRELRQLLCSSAVPEKPGFSWSRKGTTACRLRFLDIAVRLASVLPENGSNKPDTAPAFSCIWRLPCSCEINGLWRSTVPIVKMTKIGPPITIIRRSFSRLDRAFSMG
jgi:hypothetical protein